MKEFVNGIFRLKIRPVRRTGRHEILCWFRRKYALLLFHQIGEVAGIVHHVAAVGEQEVMQINDIIIGHAGDVVHHDLVGLGSLIRRMPGITGLVDIINMMTEDGRILLPQDQVLQQLLIDLGHHGLCHLLQLEAAGLIGVDHSVILTLAGLDSLEMLSI